jgi:hypothetical protein
MLMLSGPCRTALMHVKPPPALAKCESGSYAPPPVRNTSPVGKPLTVPLKPNPERRSPCATSAGAGAVNPSLAALLDDGEPFSET